ncbi:HAD family hydrolase [uncultured Dysosmobacter sp.]|uniref:HAD family hydrolase n=1 Tax=uncultured Dysosmobacter sp. TaxID=2591384 RepID=UPI00261093B0|nr:HAD family hydrolase [uncultured Dysosmobacter sp.]
MIRAVLFDVGGTLHAVHPDEALAGKFSQRLLNRLAESGIVLPIDAASLTPLLHANAEAYKHWSEEHRTELPNIRIWNEFYLKDFHVGEARLAPLAEELSVLYDAVRVRNVPRPHMRETIQTLHEMGMVQGVISNIISTTFVPRLLENYDIAQYMSCVVLSSVTGIRKPDARIFELAAAQCGVPCGEMAYVGDTLSRDVLGCRNAGIALSIQIRNPSIAHRDAAFIGTGLAPDAAIDDLSEIPAVIRSYNTPA